MSYEMKIIASEPTEFVKKVVDLALMFGVKQPAAPAEAPPAAEKAKPGRKPKADTPVEEKPVEQTEKQIDIEEVIAEKKAEDAAAKTQAETPVEVPSYDDLRAHVIENYLNVCFASNADRKAAFGELLKEFGAENIKGVPEDQRIAFKARIDELIAEKSAK